jgi:plasmid stabilization system protein ParE
VGAAEVSYRVIWEDAALTQLDEIWKASLDKEGIQNTATRINTQLTFKPLEAGESRSRNYRILFKYPLVVWFRVVERLSEVQVLHVRSAERQG